MAHGTKSVDIVAPRSRFYQGPFGRLFASLIPWSLDGKSLQELEPIFLALAQSDEMVEARTEQRDSTIPAGYTYFGQFIDHDITFDPASTLMRENDPNGLLNHRTPRIDLDSLYGSGHGATPQLYQRGDKEKFLTDSIKIEAIDFPDLPRNREGRALLGDPRNDENAIVSQLHLAFLLAHNTLVQRARDMGFSADAFEQARNTLRWLYQHLVWNDFVGRITDPAIFQNTLIKETTPDGRVVWKSNLDDVYAWKNQPFMPVEFSVAAYRFGHSMVRNGYQTNNSVRGFADSNGDRIFAPTFANNGDPDPDDLRGFRPILAKNYIQWDWFLQMATSRPPFPQVTRQIDPKLASALTALHEGPAGSPMNVLAFRNLLRGATFNLPSGSDVARKLGFTPITIPHDRDMLWFYILKEAEVQQNGQRLGQVGSVIVCATFAGLLLGDPNSYFNMNPLWTPNDDPLLDAALDNIDSSTPNVWTLGSIIRLSGLPVQGSDIPTP